MSTTFGIVAPLRPAAMCKAVAGGSGRYSTRMAPHRLDPERVVEFLPVLYRTALAWTGSREEAEDLVQDACAHVLARPRLVTGDDLHYLVRALHNELTSRRRTASRRPQTVELDEELDGGTDDPAAAAEHAEVYAAIAELPEEFRDALVAVDVAGLSYQEAARLLGLPEGTVTSRLYRARDRLARRLGA
jgi:RNA polymerase sigma-70 factor, ECF subfamily